MKRLSKQEQEWKKPLQTTLTNSDFRVLANDPSMTAWGWAVVDGNCNVIASGCIKTAPENKKRRIRKGDDTVRRASELAQTLIKIIKDFSVNYLISELPHGSQNASAAVMVGGVTFMLQTLAEVYGIGVEWYSEGDSKKALLGKLSATKEETIRGVQKHYDWTPVGIKYSDEAIADALSIHYCALQQSPVLKLMKR